MIVVVGCVDDEFVVDEIVGELIIVVDDIGFGGRGTVATLVVIAVDVVGGMGDGATFVLFTGDERI